MTQVIFWYTIVLRLEWLLFMIHHYTHCMLFIAIHLLLPNNALIGDYSDPEALHMAVYQNFLMRVRSIVSSHPCTDMSKTPCLKAGACV